MFCGDLDISKITIGPETKGYNDRPMREIMYDGKQVENIQLVKEVADALRCPWGIEAAQNENSSQRFLVDSSEASETFLKQIEEKIKQSVNDPNLPFYFSFQAIQQPKLSSEHQVEDSEIQRS